MSRPRKPRVQLGTPVLERRALWEGVADALRGAILSGRIAAGADLIEADLAARFRVSRGPVRDALRELAREGLVVDLPRRGTVVSTLTLADTTDVYEVREGIEMIAARLAISHAEDDHLAALGVLVATMEEAWDRGAEYDESLAADLAFHRALVNLAANERLIAIYEQMLSQTQLLVRTAAVMNPSLGRAMRHSTHREILDALVARDVARARQAIENHYEYAKQRLFSGIVPEEGHGTTTEARTSPRGKA